MPILYLHWDEQFYKNVTCPEDVKIPLEDIDAYKLNPQHSWAYNKLMVAEKQSIPCGPHGIPPDEFPVFSKPIYNMAGMGQGIGIIYDLETYENLQKPGYMWVELLRGDHYSTDLAVVDGKVVWICHTKGHPLVGGTFDYWEVNNQDENTASTSKYIMEFVEKNFVGYTGMMNLETIGGKIIEIHLRFSDEWPDLYGQWFIPALVDLYTNKQRFVAGETKKSYSMPVFMKPAWYRKPNRQEIDKLLKVNGVSSIQFTFFEDVAPEAHSFPPGGFRVAVINGFDVDSCRMVREELVAMMEARAVRK